MSRRQHQTATTPQVAPTRLQRNIIAVGGSAGALDAMIGIAAALPADFAGNVFVVSHVGNNVSYLPRLLADAGPLPAKHAEPDEPINPGTIYIAPPDWHMLVRPAYIGLWRGPRHHFTRPAIDPLFRSVAESFGMRVIGVVLSGAGSDGTAGLESIHLAGGKTLVQQPADALYPDMPRRAAAAVPIDFTVAAAELPALLLRLSAETIPAAALSTSKPAKSKMDELERPVAFTCPECGGALRETGSLAVKQYRCHIGHQFGPDEIAAGQRGRVEEAVELAARLLNERIELCRQMSDNARANGRSFGVAHWTQLRREAEQQLAVLRRFLAEAPIAAVAEHG